MLVIVLVRFTNDVNFIVIVLTQNRFVVDCAAFSIDEL